MKKVGERDGGGGGGNVLKRSKQASKQGREDEVNGKEEILLDCQWRAVSWW